MITTSKEFKEFILSNYDRIAMQHNFAEIKSGAIKNTSYSNWKVNYDSEYVNSDILCCFLLITSAYSAFMTYPMGSHNRYSKNDDVENIITQLFEEIDKYREKRIRSKVIAKHYNYINNEFEFELESGDFISCEKNKYQMFKIPYCVFPFEFLQKYDLASHRQVMIETIIE
jgi:hypothetical protein